MSDTSHTILIVDDSPTVVTYLEFIISRKPGFKTITAHTAEEGLAIVNSTPIDIVVSDLNLPYMSGLEACKQIKATHPTLPVIIMTAELSVDEKANAYQSGADDFIMKPFNAEQILAHIRHHLHISCLI